MNNRVVVVDVGCRWGFADEFVKNSSDFLIFGFDPDAEECKRLNDSYNSAYISAVPIGLSSTAGEKVLYLTKEPACSSLYKPDPYLTTNYPAFHCEVEVGQTVIETTTLDQWANDNNIGYIDYLKIDTQGSELDILKGGEKILKTVRSLQVEVEFNPMYIGQCLFHEIDAYLRQHGFILWKFSEITHYSQNKSRGYPINTCDVRYDEYHNVRHNVYSGQLFWANAHYVKSEVLSDNVNEGQRKKDRVLFPAIGMPDVVGLDSSWENDGLKAINGNIQETEHEAIIHAMKNSLSWRITAPLRKASQLLRSWISWLKK